jgi:hypothetical protein
MDVDPKLELDRQVRRSIYDGLLTSAVCPTAAEIATLLSVPLSEVRAALGRLADAHILVLQPDTGEVLMANPFSTVPTPFLVRAGVRSYFGNCIWDALGIPAMLRKDAVIDASCGDCGTAMTLRITNGELEPAEGLAHFAVPAVHWWANIVFT